MIKTTENEETEFKREEKTYVVFNYKVIVMLPYSFHIRFMDVKVFCAHFLCVRFPWCCT